MKIKIVDIKPVPRWKFWKVDNIEVTLEDEYGNRKTISIYEKPPVFKSLFKVYIEEKYCTGDQWRSFHQKEKKIKKKKPTTSKEELIIMQTADLLGVTFDCVDVLSKGN